MADELDQSAEDTGASAEAPASNSGAADLDSIVNALTGKIDERFSGFQSLIDKKISPLAQELAELKTAGMSPEEREQHDQQAALSRNEQLERENQFLKARQSDPDAVDFLMELDKAESFDDQLALIKRTFGAKAAAQVEAAVEETPEGATTPAVDSNNPARDPKLGVSTALATGQVGSEAEADELLRLAGTESRASIRKRNG